MTRKSNDNTRGKPAAGFSAGTRIAACGREADLGVPVIRWDQPGGWPCPHRRGRRACRQHAPALNQAPTQKDAAYRIFDLDAAYRELTQAVHQLVLHYDVCFSSWHCHRILGDSTFKGSHFYLDLDGTVYQTCDPYWKTNTAPADDGQGNERSVHVEMANLSWQALAAESDLHGLTRDAYVRTPRGWKLNLPEEFRRRLHRPESPLYAARGYGQRGFFSRWINGRRVRMWDFTPHQYHSLVRLCLGVNELLPRVRLRVPFDPRKRRVPLSRLPRFRTFAGILGHAHVQAGKTEGVKCKYDPGSAFNWGFLRRELQREARRRKLTGDGSGTPAPGSGKSC